jgi:hypothetical protein
MKIDFVLVRLKPEEAGAELLSKVAQNIYGKSK